MWIIDDIIDRLKNKTTLTIAGGKVGILVFREAARLRKGLITEQEFRVRAGGHLGSSAGIILGAATGAAVGAIVPGIGNIAGAFTGGVIGAMSGEEVGRFAASLIARGIAPKPKEEEAPTDQKPAP